MSHKAQRSRESLRNPEFRRRAASQRLSISRLLALPLAFVVVGASLCSAAVLNPVNGHYYEAIPGPITWNTARVAAEGKSLKGTSGHLATITSHSEQEFIDAHFPGLNYWIGASQPVGATEPDGDWEWLTGEDFGLYTNWRPGEPNNVGDNEHVAHIGTGGGNDIHATHNLPGYLVEFDVVAPLPGMLPYQGLVSVEDNVFIGPAAHFKFALVNWDGSQTYWSNDDSSVTGSEPTTAVTLLVSEGRFAVALGNTTLQGMTEPIPSSLFVEPDLHLRIWFSDGNHGFQRLYPDQRILPVGYAMRAASAGIADRTADTPPPGMRLIPGGTFAMGASREGDSDQLPVHDVEVAAFFLSQTEVTQQLWDKVVSWAVVHGYAIGNRRTGNLPNHPAELLTWYDAIKWCNARSEMEGLTPVYYTDNTQTTIYRVGEIDLTTDAVRWNQGGYRLPTEAEWERAARGGLRGNYFPWPSFIGTANEHIDATKANYENSGDPFEEQLIKSTPVASYPSNEYGLHDTAGNVSEWCWDWYQSNWYQHPDSTQANPRGPNSGSERVIRGGNWSLSSENLRCSKRFSMNPQLGGTVGFRVARSR